MIKLVFLLSSLVSFQSVALLCMPDGVYEGVGNFAYLVGERGVGLATARAIVQGGKIQQEITLNEGSKLQFSLTTKERKLKASDTSEFFVQVSDGVATGAGKCSPHGVAGAYHLYFPHGKIKTTWSFNKGNSRYDQWYTVLPGFAERILIHIVMTKVP